MCHQIINHSYFGNIVLCCILISSGMLAAEDPLNPNSDRNTVKFNFIDLSLNKLINESIKLYL